MGLRGRPKMLQKATERKTVTPLRLECGEGFRVHQNTSLDCLAHEWLEETRAESYRKTPEDVLRLVAHTHDPSLFLDKADSKPWPGEFFHGVSWMPQPEDVRISSSSRTNTTAKIHDRRPMRHPASGR